MKQIVVYAIIFCLLWMLWEYWYYRFNHIENLFQMYSVEPLHESFWLWEKPFFVTNAEYKVAWKITRDDIQYCFIENDYVYYSLYTSTTFNTWHNIVENKPRRYNLEWPDTPTRCYLKTITTITLPFWVKRSNINISSPYYYN